MPVLQKIQRVFPPPRYITLPSVGVDISDTSLKYIQFEREHVHDTYLALTAWGDIDIPAGIVERGNVHDVAKLTAVLREMKARTKAQFVRVSLPEERAYLFETSIDRNISRKDIRGLLEFKLEENVPLSPRDAYFDYDVVGSDTANNAHRIAVAVYARDTINNYYDACTAAELTPVSFEIEAQAIARASVDTHLSGTYMIVDFGKTRMGVGIVHRGALMYTSTIDISGQQMSIELRKVLGDLPESQLTEIKNTKGIVQTKDNEAVHAALSGITASIADELSVRIHYWHTRDIDRGERQIKKVILCGGSANLLGLPEFLTTSLGVPTERAQVWQNAFSLNTFVPPITRKYSYGYATAIGLALKDFIE